MSISPKDGRSLPPPVANALANALRSRRERAGLSQGELARMAGVSAGTLSTLEAGANNPTVATLWALCAVLGCDMAEVVGLAVDPMVGFVAAGEGIHPEGSLPGSRLLHRFAPNGPVELYEVELERHADHESAPHPQGVYEHVYVTNGALSAGPRGAPLTMSTGDYACFQAWLPHVYRAGPTGARLVLFLSYTRSLWATRELLGHGTP